jgi:peptide chain release factor subunit 1
MLTHREIKELSTVRGDKNFFVSLYLDVNPLTNPKRDYGIHFKNMLKEVTRKIGRDTKNKIKEDLEKIEKYLTDNKKKFNKGIAIISSKPLGLWKSYHLSLPVKNELIVDSTPYIKPLLTLLDNYQRYAVLLVDKESARIFVIYLGKIEDYTELFTPDVPGKHKKGGWFALEQTGYERHINYHVSMHIKDVIKTFEDFLHKEAINRIIIGGTEEAVVKIKDMLPQIILNKVITTFPAEMILREKDVLNKTLKIIEKFEREEEKNIVEDLITKTMKNNMAVLGIENILANLQEGKVMKLVFLRDMTARGFKCSNCHFLTVQAIKFCPYCRRKFEEIHYLIDFAVQMAIEQGALIKVITKSNEFAKAGGIGAFLRF